MKSIVYWTWFLFALWLILSSSLDIQNIIVGFGVSYATALLYVKMFKDETTYSFNLPAFMSYVWILFKNLVKSNLQINKRILSKNININPAIVAVETELQSDWKKLLLANSITLTPGTLTLDIKGDTLFIHILEYEDGMDKKVIIKEFEDAISKI
jgi:multicomponent Na+:H+ antiporter subunit E